MKKNVLAGSKESIPPNLIDSIQNKRWKTDLEKGHEDVDTIRKYCGRYDSIMGIRTLNQLRMIEAMLISCAYIFYASVIDQDLKLILERNRWERIVQVIPISAPRREGKSEITALFIAAMLYHMPNMNVLLVVPNASMGNLQSGLLGRTALLLDKIFNVGPNDYIRRNDKMIQFEINGSIKTMRVEYQVYGKLQKIDTHKHSFTKDSLLIRRDA